MMAHPAYTWPSDSNYWPVYGALSVANRAGPANATNAKSDVMGVTLPSWYRASTYITFLPCEL